MVSLIRAMMHLRSLMAIRAKLASSRDRGREVDVVSTLPPNKAMVLFDFAAQEPTDLALTRYAACM